MYLNKIETATSCRPPVVLVLTRSDYRKRWYWKMARLSTKQALNQNVWKLSFYNGFTVCDTALYVKPIYGWHDMTRQIVEALQDAGYWINSNIHNYRLTTRRDDCMILESEYTAPESERDVPCWIIANLCDYDSHPKIVEI